MKHFALKKVHKAVAGLCALFSLLLISSCGVEGFSLSGVPQFSNPDYERTPPPLRLAEFKGENMQTRYYDDGRFAEVDLTSIAEGYVGVKANSGGVRARFKVARGEGEERIYELRNDAQPDFYPLSYGSGHYTFTVYFHLPDAGSQEVVVVLTAEADASITDEKAPYLVQNQQVNYSAASEAVQFSYEICQSAVNDMECAQQIYYWMTHNIAYDTEKAVKALSNLLVGYTPDVDDTLRTRTGICYDYAALTAAMLRANGIPCRLVIGKVLRDGTPMDHAWNEVYFAEKGWLALDLATTPRSWLRVDTTFATAQDPSILQFIGDGENYYPSSYQ